MADIAALAEVSVATVSRALADHPAITPETKARVLAAAKAQGYALNSIPRKIRHAQFRRPRKAGSICIVMPVAHQLGSPLANAFELSLLGGIGAAMRDRGIDFQISAHAPFDDISLAKFMASHPYHGVIFLGQSQYHTALNKLADSPRPFVVWGVEAPGQRYCSVGSNNFEGGFSAAEHLLGLGRRQLVFIGQSAPITSAQTGLSQLAERRAGFSAAHTAMGVAPGKFVMRSRGPGRQAGSDAIEELLDQGHKFDGIVGSSDYIAIGAIEALVKRGCSVPGDVAVIGYDDSEVADFARPGLTSIRQDTILAGDLLVSKLLRLMDGHQVRSERLPTTIVIRESCGGATDQSVRIARKAKLMTMQ